jgi:nitrogen fixation-related uncharacterized protein
MHNATLAALDWTPDQTGTKFRAVLLLLISLALIMITLSALLGPAKRGQTSDVMDRVIASLIAMIPAAIGVAGVGIALGAAFLNWAVPGVSK